MSNHEGEWIKMWWRETERYMKAYLWSQSTSRPRCPKRIGTYLKPSSWLSWLSSRAWTGSGKRNIPGDRRMLSWRLTALTVRVVWLLKRQRGRIGWALLEAVHFHPQKICWMICWWLTQTRLRCFASRLEDESRGSRWVIEVKSSSWKPASPDSVTAEHAHRLCSWLYLGK